MYWERGAAAGLGFVVWGRRDEPDDGDLLVVPDGCMDVIWGDGALLVAGPDTRATVVEPTAGAGYAGIRFRPGVGPGVLGVPAHELRDARVPLSDVWPRRQVATLAERIAAEGTGALERFVTARMRAPETTGDATMRAVARALAGGKSVAAVADATGLSERQLHRRALAAFGYGPKTLARILRFERAVALARRDVPFAVAAARAGYADQAHMSREVRALTGTTLSVLRTNAPSLTGTLDG